MKRSLSKLSKHADDKSPVSLSVHNDTQLCYIGILLEIDHRDDICKIISDIQYNETCRSTDNPERVHIISQAERLTQTLLAKKIVPLIVDKNLW